MKSSFPRKTERLAEHGNSSWRRRTRRTSGAASAKLVLVMRYLHTMLRVQNLDSALDFFVNKLGLTETRRSANENGRFTLVFLGSGDPTDSAEVELTYNWDQAEPYPTGRFFGHL